MVDMNLKVYDDRSNFYNEYLGMLTITNVELQGIMLLMKIRSEVSGS